MVTKRSVVVTGLGPLTVAAVGVGGITAVLCLTSLEVQG